MYKKNDLAEKEGNPDDDETNKPDDNDEINKSDDDDNSSPTTAPVKNTDEIKNPDDTIISETKETEVEEDPESATIIIENEDTDKTPNTGTRKSTRKRVQRMVIETDDIGDCDNINDPDYRS